VVAPTDESWSIGLVVPDNDPVGLADTRIIAGSPVRSIAEALKWKTITRPSR
jgi:hypothetical protein